MRLDGFGLFVDDMAKMIRFYKDVLGFEIKEEENEDENSKIYRESQIIGDIRKQEEEKIEFTVKIKDDYFNN